MITPKRILIGIIVFLLGFFAYQTLKTIEEIKPSTHERREIEVTAIEEIQVVPPKYTKKELQKQQYADELTCLQENIYFEARGEGTEGMFAVANVTMNRVKQKHYPHTVCKVVYEGIRDSFGNVLYHQCQFTWTCDNIPDVIAQKDVWEHARIIAKLYLDGNGENVIGEATNYHNDTVVPAWAKNMETVAIIGRHIFYAPRVEEEPMIEVDELNTHAVDVVTENVNPSEAIYTETSTIVDVVQSTDTEPAESL